MLLKMCKAKRFHCRMENEGRELLPTMYTMNTSVQESIVSMEIYKHSAVQVRFVQTRRICQIAGSLKELHLWISSNTFTI